MITISIPELNSNPTSRRSSQPPPPCLRTHPLWFLPGLIRGGSSLSRLAMEARSWSPPPRPYCHASAPSPSPPPQPPHTPTCLVLLNFFSALFTDSGFRVFLAPLSCFKQIMKTSRGGSVCATPPISIFLLSFQVGAAVKWEQFAISRCRPSLPNYRPPNCSHISNCNRGAESLNEK